MKKVKLYRKWWFKYVLAPLGVALIAGICLHYFRPKVQENIGSTLIIEGDLNVKGDFVGRNKYEINLSKLTVYKDLERIYVENVKAKINTLNNKYPDKKIKILLAIINVNSETKRFAYEFKNIIEESGISVSVVPHIVLGLPPRDFPIYFKYNGLERDLVMDFIWCIDQFFSPQKGQIKI